MGVGSGGCTAGSSCEVPAWGIWGPAPQVPVSPSKVGRVVGPISGRHDRNLRNWWEAPFRSGDERSGTRRLE